MSATSRRQKALTWLTTCFPHMPQGVFEALLHHRQYPGFLTNPMIEATISNVLGLDSQSHVLSSWGHQYTALALGIRLPAEKSATIGIDRTKWTNLYHDDPSLSQILGQIIQTSDAQAAVTASIFTANKHGKTKEHFKHLSGNQHEGSWETFWDAHSFSWQHAHVLGEILSRHIAADNPNLGHTYIPVTVQTLLQRGREEETGQTHRFSIVISPLKGGGCGLSITQYPWEKSIYAGSNIVMRDLQWWKED